jgi:hypothetical protein
MTCGTLFSKFVSSCPGCYRDRFPWSYLYDPRSDNQNSKNGLQGTVVGAVGSGSRPVVGNTKESVTVSYPRYVFSDWFKNVSLPHILCVRWGVRIPPLYSRLTPRLVFWKRDFLGRGKMIPHTRWVLVVSFGPFHTVTVKLSVQVLLKSFNLFFPNSCLKREVKRRLTHVCRCDERLRAKTEGSTLLTYTGSERKWTVSTVYYFILMNQESER